MNVLIQRPTVQIAAGFSFIPIGALAFGQAILNKYYSLTIKHLNVKRVAAYGCL